MREQPGYPLAKITANKSSSEHCLPPLICPLSRPYKVILVVFQRLLACLKGLLVALEDPEGP